MDCVRAVVYLSVCLSVATAVFTARSEEPADPQDPRDPRDSRDPYYQLGFSTNDLSELLQEDRLSVEKKASIIPRCDVGERCAMKHGPRIGRLCDCLRGAACNTFFLRCY
ncbi:unnamed protein product [Merluccius merluccius]